MHNEALVRARPGSSRTDRASIVKSNYEVWPLNNGDSNQVQLKAKGAVEANGIADQWLRDILRTLYQQRSATRSNIIEATGLNAGSVSRALRVLMRSGTILKVGELESAGGRRREVLTLNQDAAHFIGIDLESHRIRLVLTSFCGDVRYRWEEQSEPSPSLDIQKLFDGIERVAGTLNPQQLERLLAVGISFPGLMDQEGRLTAVNLGWRQFPFMAEFEKIRNARGFEGLPVFMEQDRHSTVRAEQWLGRARLFQNGAYVSCDRGIGVGIFLNGQAVKGWHDMAGELGHMTVEPDAADRCNCGKRGCLEAIATSDNIVRQYLEKTGKEGGRAASVQFSEVLERARKNEEAAVAVMRRACRAWGLALSHVVNLLNPEVIILGGDLVAGDDLFLPLIKEELFRHCLPELTEGLEITMSSLGLDIRLKAAASLAFQNCLADPELLRKMCSPVLMPGKPATYIAEKDMALNI
jgi:predicted NBD/HSP70 family sugar kinase